MSVNSIYPPDIVEIFKAQGNKLKAEINCMQIGKINTYDSTTQSCKVEIQVKRELTSGEIREYPVLLDVPVFVLQGGGGYIEFPIEAGDFCLVFFNDRNIDTWWKTANVTAPPTKRKHSIADGFAFIGINPETSVLTLDGKNVNLWGPDESNKITITPDGNFEIGASGSPAAARVDDTTISDTTTDSSFWAWAVKVNAFNVTWTAALAALTSSGGTPAGVVAYAAAMTTALTTLGSMPSSLAGKIDSGSEKVVIE